MNTPLLPLEATNAAFNATNKADQDAFDVGKRVFISEEAKTFGIRASLISRRIPALGNNHMIASAEHALASSAHKDQADAHNAAAKELERGAFRHGLMSAPFLRVLATSHQVASDAHRAAFVAHAAAAISEINGETSVGK